jgi:hypothetical protein
METPFLIALPAAIAGSLLLKERLVWWSTRNRKRSSTGRACPFGFSAAGGFGLVNVGLAGIMISKGGGVTPKGARMGVTFLHVPGDDAIE